MAARQVSYRLQSEGKAQVKRDFAEVGEAGSAAGDKIARAADRTAAATKRQTEGYQKLAAAARDAQRAEERNAAFDRVLGVGGGSGKSAADSAAVFEEKMGPGLSRAQRAGRLNLVRQGADVFTTAAMGMDPAMIAIQQGPQILDAMATSGIKLSRSMMVVGGSIAAVGAAVLTTAAAYNHGEAAAKKMEVAASGLGAASRMTGGELEAAAEQGAKLGDVSVGSARDMAEAYVSTGRIGGDVLTGLIGMTRDYAATTRQDAAGATKELAGAFADPARGAAELNAKLNFLHPAQLRHIENLAMAGDKAGAQRVMMDALKVALVDASDAATGLGNAWDVIGRKVANAWDWMGRALYRIAGGGEDITKLAELRSLQSRFGVAYSPQQNAALQRQIADLEAKIKATAARQLAANDNQRAAEVQAIIDRNNPNDARLRGLKGDETRLSNELRRNPQAANANELTAALKKTRDEIKAIEAGYGSAAQQASLLTRQQNAGERAADAAARAAERQAAETLRHIEALTDLDLQNRTAIARAIGDQDVIKSMEKEARLRALISTYEANGVESAEARARAQAQVARETEAEAEARRRAELQKTPEGFVSAEEQMRPFRDLKLTIDDSAEALEHFKQIGEDAFDSFADLVLDGNLAWDDWKEAGLAAMKEILKEALILSAINPLKNILFGQNNPTVDASASGWGQIFKMGAQALGSIFGGPTAGAPAIGQPPIMSDAGGIAGHLATGTAHWRGGRTWVGEEGPELVDLPAGSRVYDARRSRAMAANDRGPPIQVTIHAKDAESFNASRGQVASTIARALQLAARTS